MGARVDSPETPDSPPEGTKQESPNLHLVNAATSTPQALPDKRPLTEAEIQMLRKVFDAGLNYPVVRLTRMNRLIEVLNGSRAYTLGNTVHLPGKAYAYLHQYPSLLVHELVHVWQYQRDGWSYVPSALWAQTAGDGYDFAKALRQGKAWKDMNPEQQGQMIQDAYRGVYFDTPGALFGVLNNKGCVVRPGTPPPDGFTDYTSSLVAALELLRKPR
jgi:hypothetical protein